MLIEDYINLHKIPELGFNETKTSTYIYNRIKYSKAKITIIKTGICAFFNFNKNKTIAFRAELDGLKIKENTALPYSSIHNGYMHACGHDGHMSILLSLIDYINNRKDYKYNVLFVFQPSEEKLGGALSLLNHLDKYNFEGFFGMHVFPYLNENAIYSSKNVLFSSATEIDITTYAKSVHIGNYNKRNDAIYKLTKKINFLKKKAKENDMILEFNTIRGGISRNITCNKCISKGSLRTNSSKKAEDFIKKYIINQTNFKYKISKTIPELINDSNLLNRLYKKINFTLIDKTYFQAEDFSFYKKEYHPCYFLLGTKNKSPLHSDDFYLSYEDLLNGFNFYLSLINHLNEEI